jgi:hypothetical protein
MTTISIVKPIKEQQASAPSSLPEKWQKVLKDMPEFKDTADAASVEDLKKILVTCEGNIYTIEQEKAEDTKLNGARELAKEYAAPYRDAIKTQTAKIKYALFLLESKGVELNNQEKD